MGFSGLPAFAAESGRMSRRGNGSEVSENKEARRELEGAFYETVCRVVTDNRCGKIDRVSTAVIS
jgi:hypothetical protein